MAYMLKRQLVPPNFLFNIGTSGASLIQKHAEIL